MRKLQASYYNFLVDHDRKTLLFNGITGALLALDAHQSAELKPFLGERRGREAGVGYKQWSPTPFLEENFPPNLSKHLSNFIDAGIFILAESDERDIIKKSYFHGKRQAPMFITITTTLNCNMRCYYCYQKEDDLGSMSLEKCDEIINWTKEEIYRRNPKVVYVDWYGGEPMLNQPVIERYSAEISKLCDNIGIEYKASMICNGTAWPDDPKRFIDINRIKRIQFSIDGPERHHNKRRGLIKNDGKPGRTASFQQVIDLIDKVVDITNVYLRINVDPFIGRDALELIDICAEMGWLERKKTFFPYVAVINAMTEHCGFIGKSEKFKSFEKEFDNIQSEFCSMLRCYRDESSLEAVQYFPSRVIINCSAVSENSIIFGPNGLAYKCSLDVGDEQRAHASINKSGMSEPTTVPNLLPVDRWDKYDPLSHPRCGECQYLPVCMGGCPKAQIENDTNQIRMQSEFWENNFDRVIREYYSASIRDG